MNTLRAYIQYRRKAVNQYGLHSPFMFDLYNAVFKPAWTKEEPEEPEILREKLRHDSTRIEVTDLGAGSKKMKSPHRSISSIARHSVKRKKYARLVSRLIRYFDAMEIIELGTSLGVTTVYLSRSTNGNVYTLEGCPQTAARAQQNILSEKCGNVELIVGDFKTTLPGLRKKTSHFDIAFVDGWHTYEGTLFCFNQLCAIRKETSIIVFDDIHWSEEMERAWAEIRNHKDITATIDIFEMGIAFFNPDLSRETFYLKY